MSDVKPYLNDFRRSGSANEPFKFRVFTPVGVQEFDINGYRIDTSHLILYRETTEGEAEGITRAFRVAVFVPGGWLGDANDSSFAHRDMAAWALSERQTPTHEPAREIPDVRRWQPTCAPRGACR